MSFNLDNYNDVPHRIKEFREKYPDGSLQQVSYELLTVGDKTFVAYTAAAYRHPGDERPGHGTAWEPVPGHTSYTHDSELMNAETSAWGRAIVAVLAADTTKGIASKNEVQNRQAAPVEDKGVQAVAEAFNTTPTPTPAADTNGFVFKFGKYKGKPLSEADDNYLEWLIKQPAKSGYEQKHAQDVAVYRAELDRRGA